MKLTPGAYGTETRATSAPWACSHLVAGLSPWRRHATDEYGTASAAQPVDRTVAVTASPSRIGVERLNEHGGGGGAGPVALATPPPAPNASAHAITTTPGLPIGQD